MSCAKILKRFQVATPYGLVHVVAFEKLASPHHRQVILEILSEASGRTLVKDDIVQSKEHPRPELPALDFDVNWTHSGKVCVLAYGEPGTRSADGTGLKVGVDFEIHKDRGLHIADHFYSQEEVAYLKSLEPASAKKEFFRLWCRKEAFYKCVGGSFFEGSVRRNVLDSKHLLDDGHELAFLDIEEPLESVDAALCVAVSR